MGQPIWVPKYSLYPIANREHYATDSSNSGAALKTLVNLTLTLHRQVERLKEELKEAEEEMKVRGELAA